MRNQQNQPLELSSIFLHSKQQLEYVVNTPTSLLNISGVNLGPSNGLSSLLNNSELNKSQAKHKQFKLTVYGAGNNDDELKDQVGVQVKVTQETTVLQVIEQVTAYIPRLCSY